MKLSFISVDGIEYVTQHNKEFVFFSTKGEDKTRKMVAIDILYGEIKRAVVMKSGDVKCLPVVPEFQFNKSAHDIVRHYAPLMQGFTFDEKNP